MTPGEAVTGLSYLVGAGVFVWAARRKRLATEGMAILGGVGFVAGIVGAKLTQLVASGWPFRLPASAALDPRAGGRALLGGLAFGWLAVEIAKRRMGIRRSTGDLFALALPAGEAVGRIGCHLNGCCYGERCDAPWAVWQHDAWRYPAQLLSSASAALTFLFLLWLASEPLSPLGERGRVEGCGDDRDQAYAAAAPHPCPSPPEGRGVPRLREGDLFRVYLLLFGVTRFALEFVRWRESTMAGLSPMQWFCLDLIVIALVGLLRRKKDGLPQLQNGV